jgi:hypothetical protein
MDSNSTLVPIPQSSSQEGERSCVKEGFICYGYL